MICAPSEDSDQPGHPPSLISLRCPHEETLGPQLPIEHTAKTPVRLGGCGSQCGSYKLYLSHDMTKPTKLVCAQRKLRSAWASTQSDQVLAVRLMGS